jgi:hypothetical protein
VSAASDDVQDPFAKRPWALSDGRDRVSRSIAESIDKESRQVASIGDEDGCGGDAGLALPMREHDDAI